MLFVGLKNENHRSIKITTFSQLPRCAKKHGGMAVMAAGVHHALIARYVVMAAFLGDWQGIHVSPQSNCAIAGAGPQYANNTTPFVSFDAHAGQQFDDPRPGAHFLKAKFRILVKIPAQFRQIGNVCHQAALSFSITASSISKFE